VRYRISTGRSLDSPHQIRVRKRDVTLALRASIWVEVLHGQEISLRGTISVTVLTVEKMRCGLKFLTDRSLDAQTETRQEGY
jgi:hypothetical protein